MSDKFPKPSGDCITDRMRQRAAEAKAASSFAASACSAALLEIIKTCEQYQNADFEGKELEHQCDEGYRCSMKVITIASAAIQELEARQNEKLSDSRPKI